MAKAIHFDRAIDSESISWLIEQINNIDVDIVIYMRSDGGDPNVTPPLIDLINQLSQEERIMLIGYGYISSAAFDIFWLAECPKKVLPGTYSIVHKANYQMDKNNKEHLEIGKVIEYQNELLFHF